MKVNINYANVNIPIEIYADEHISNIIKNTNSFYEIKFLEYISQNYNKHNTIIDIGANIGNHSLFFSEFLEYDVEDIVLSNLHKKINSNRIN